MNAAKILVVEDDAPLREALCDTLALAGYQALEASDGRHAVEILGREQVDMVVTDVQMQHMNGHELLAQIKLRWHNLPVLLMTAHGTIQRAVDAIRSGAADYLVKPFDADVLVNMVERFVASNNVDGELVAESAQSLQLRELASRVAKSDATIMISGESGTGKEVLARFIHNNSDRADQPFVAINCAAIPENMLEATLFGYEKGAFTGAYKSSAGKFEQAQHGTLLLDEISEMDLGLQAKLLRVLQEREVERLGGSKVIELDVRVLATSNRNMHEEVSAGRFREDLFYRLNVFPLHISPLRERSEDVVPIAVKLIERHATRAGGAIPRLSAEARQRLQAHHWQGNVRELDNVIQRAMILHQDDIIDAADLVFGQQAASRAPHVETVVVEAEVSGEPAAEVTLGGDLRKHEHAKIIDVLRSCMGNRKIAAERLGISPRTLRYKLARMRDAGLSVPGL